MYPLVSSILLYIWIYRQENKKERKMDIRNERFSRMSVNMAKNG